LYPEENTPYQFTAGGCLDFDFQPVASYLTLPAESTYYLWPGDVATTKPDCTGLTPTGVTCELLTNFRIRLTIPSATEEISGVIGGMKLPFSMGALKLNSIAYRTSGGQGCAK